ncbi:ATP-binding protein [Solwaraspora sp. WMMD1047]|uniref:ATP-binding protein n=1 Tax=Solwaraspora sp. WMMD1047 TaxID=3016102 RepID=UPI0024175D87|nr:ATP-binding protein [Solwaraspora sp. WMMD1047]MDG4833166.1 ATP-binding protein [Solwaraspora sp. WMMD1047]
MERDELHTLLRLIGVLDQPATATVRDELLTQLADQPTAVAIDISGLRVAEPAVLGLFAEVVEEAAEWPTGRPLLSYRPVGDRDLARLGADLPPARRLSAELAPVVGAARAARELITEGCTRWGLRQLTDSACLAVTELVNNVVVHARTRMTVRLAWRAGALRLAVRDYSTRHPNPVGPAPPTSPGGRGLLLIESAVRRWGATGLTDGKVVWAVLYPQDEPALG